MNKSFKLYVAGFCYILSVVLMFINFKLGIALFILTAFVIAIDNIFIQKILD